MSKLDVQPLKYSHQEVLHCALEEENRRKGVPEKERTEQEDVGWLKISGRYYYFQEILSLIASTFHEVKDTIYWDRI